jgi:hypothetical protein
MLGSLRRSEGSGELSWAPSATSTVAIAQTADPIHIARFAMRKNGNPDVQKSLIEQTKNEMSGKFSRAIQRESAKFP